MGMKEFAVSGPKFYAFDQAARECYLFNMDYSPWKTISFSVPSTVQFVGFVNVSESLVPPNTEVELIISYRDNLPTGNKHYIDVIGENGALIDQVDSASIGRFVYVNSLQEYRLLVLSWDDDYNYIKTREFSFNGPLGLSEESHSQAPVVYPNPAQEQVFMDLSGLPEADWELTWYDRAGHLLQTPQILSTSSQRIQLPPVPAGVYFYRLSAPIGVYQGKLLIE